MSGNQVEAPTNGGQIDEIGKIEKVQTDGNGLIVVEDPCGDRQDGGVVDVGWCRSSCFATEGSDFFSVDFERVAGIFHCDWDVF